MLILGTPIRCVCLILTGMLAISALTGCQSSPRNPKASIKGTPLERLDRFAIAPETLDGLGYRIDWRSAVPLGPNPRLESIDAYSDIVVVQTADTLLSVLDTSTGALRHSNELTDATSTLAGNTRLGGLIVSSVDSDAYFVDPVSGDLLDRQSFEGVLASKPVPFGGTLLATSNTGIVLSHTTASGGYPLWRFGARNPIDTPVALSGSTAVVVTRSGRVLGFEATSGQLVGENSIFMGPDGSDPIASDSTVFIASPDQSVYAFDAFDMALRWRVRTAMPLREQITLIGSVLYVPTLDRGLLALDAATGKQLWSAPDVRGVVLTTRGETLIAWANGRAWSIDAADGSVRGAFDVPGVELLAADSVSEGTLYAVSKDNIAARLVARR